MEPMLASEAYDKVFHTNFNMVARDTEELMSLIIKDIEKAISEGEISTVVYTRKRYRQEAVERAQQLLAEKGYFSEQFDGLRLGISWDTKNPFGRGIKFNDFSK